MSIATVIAFTEEGSVRVSPALCAAEVPYWVSLGNMCLATGCWLGDQVMLQPSIPHDVRTAMMLRLALHMTLSERTTRLTKPEERGMLAYLLACEAEEDGYPMLIAEGTTA